MSRQNDNTEPKESSTMTNRPIMTPGADKYLRANGVTVKPGFTSADYIRNRPIGEEIANRLSRGLPPVEEKGGDLDALVKKVSEWADEKGLNNPDKQILKAMSELGELADAHAEKQPVEEVMDAVGDTTVTLIAYCNIMGIDFAECLQMAYDTIKNRKGKTVDGVFVKESE